MSLEEILSTSDTSVLFNVFQLPFLSQETCAQLTKEILTHRLADINQNSMQKYIIDVSHFLADFLRESVDRLTPSINDLFYFGENHTYSIFNAYAIYYNATGEGEKSLNTHVDDSDITVNITLMKENLDGCEVYFTDAPDYGNAYCIKNFSKMKQKLQKGSSSYSIKPEVGTCMLHYGNHPHMTSQIQSGKRVSLILWLKRKL